MKFRPVRRSRPPGYPTRVEVLADPRLFRARTPAAWRVPAGLASAATVLLGLGLPGCGHATDARAVAAADDMPAGPASTRLASNPRFRRVVAPIFERGDGIRPGGGGSFYLAGVNLNPTPEVDEEIAMTEENALEVIREELAKIGVRLTDEKVVVYHGPPRDPEHAERKRDYWTQGLSPWVVDAVDPDRRVAVEFISQKDHDYLWFAAGSWDYEFKKAARWVSKQFAVEDVDPYLYAVFYDPGGDVNDPAQLRAQVRDFVEWLKLNAPLAANGQTPRSTER